MTSSLDGRVAAALGRGVLGGATAVDASLLRYSCTPPPNYYAQRHEFEV